MSRVVREEPVVMTEEVVGRAAAFFRAAGDVGRLKLLLRLQAREATVTELATAAALPMSTVSQQLRLLRTEQLVKRRRSGKQLFYSVVDAHVRDLVLLGIAHATHTR